MVIENAHCSVPLSFSFRRLGCEGFDISRSNCSQNLSLISLGKEFNSLRTESGMTMLLAKMFSRLFDGLKYFYSPPFDIFSRTGNPLLPFFAPEPSLASRHFNYWTDDNFTFAGFYLDTLPDLQRNLRANVLGNSNLELFTNLNRGSHRNLLAAVIL